MAQSRKKKNRNGTNLGFEEKDVGQYHDVHAFCKSATTEEIANHRHVLAPGRYVGAEAAEEDDEPFDEAVQRLTYALAATFAESANREKRIAKNLPSLSVSPEKPR